ncbi:MAG: ABC transporter substrate-binding protein [Zetaproteobacteria bacterium]|nr:ABC transporter substrate-binding protein [Zetaproteobacteria bacterium]
MLLIMAGCSAIDQGNDISRAEHTIRVALAQMPSTTDPRFATDAISHRIQAFVHRGLVKMDEHFFAVPDAAESWQHPNPLLWIFHLRHDLYFHDGSRVTAEDVAATLQSVMNAALGSPLRAGFAAIESIEVVADDQLKIVLNRADASFLNRLTVGILSKNDSQQRHQSRGLMGCGPYQVSAWEDQMLRLHPVHGDRPDLLWMMVKDPVTRSLKMVRGEIDFMQNDIPPHLIPYLEKNRDLQIRDRPSTTFSYIGMNLQDERLKDRRVRQALALGLDRNLLKRALLGDKPILAETVLIPTHWAGIEVLHPPFDTARAEALLDEAGFPRQKNGMRFSMIYRTSTNPTRLQMVTAIADMWGKIGIDVQIQSMEWGGFYARIRRGDFEVYSLDWVAVSDPDIYRWILHSTMWPPSGSNRGRYANAAVDGWLDAAAASDDVMERKQLYRKVQQQMVNDWVYIPLWYAPVIAVSGPRLREAIVPTADGSFLPLMQAKLK